MTKKFIKKLGLLQCMSPANSKRGNNLADKIVIATQTFYDPNPNGPNFEMNCLRSELAREFVKAATNKGFGVVVVDGGSADKLLRDFERYGAKVFEQAEPGMGPGRRQAIRMATDIGRQIISWSEPEKVEYIHELEIAAGPINEGDADMVIPARRSMSSLPRVQQLTETLGNIMWKDITGKELDIFFGPKIWGRDRYMSQYFLRYDGGYGDRYDSIIIPVMDAMRDGKRVVGKVIAYEHPTVQTRFEEGKLGIKRKYFEQLESIVKFTTDYWKRTEGRLPPHFVDEL
jgi:glycosyltransferase involved in cell wall biosynthesis